MAKNQSIVRLRGSIDGVTYTEGVNGKLSRSRSSLTKAKMDANPKFRKLRQMQSELGSYARFGALLRSGAKSELVRVKPYRGVQRINKLFNEIKNEDPVHRMGKRTVMEGLNTVRGRNLLLDFDFYGTSSVSALLEKQFVVDLATGEARITAFNPIRDLLVPDLATHVQFKAVFIGLDSEESVVSTKRSPEVVLPIADVEADLVLQSAGLPDVSVALFYVVQILFINEVNGFREMLETNAFTILDIGV